MKTIAPLVLVAALVAGCGSGASPGGGPAPDFTVEPLSQAGQTVSLASKRGKVVLIDFWATWCGPCRDTMPIVQRLHESHQAKGLEIMAITDEERGVVESFKKSSGTTYPVYLDSSGAAFSAYKVDGIPHAVVIDRKGEVVFTGHPADVEPMSAAIEKALAN